MFKNRWHRNYFIRRYLYGPVLMATANATFRCRLLISRSLYRLHRPIFIIGVSRSGTTIFTEAFCRHRELCGWSEAAQILESRFYDREIDTLQTEYDVTQLDKFRIQFFFGVKTHLTGKARFVNKHPENSLRIRFLKSIFPDAMFIHLIRDGWSTVVSNCKRTYEDPFRTRWPFGQFPKPPMWRSYLSLPLIEQFAHQWVDIIEYIRTQSQDFLKPSDYTEVRYEEFCERPHAVLAAVDNFCVLSRLGRDYSQIPAVLKNQNLRWRQAITPEQAATIAAVIGPLNRELGYADWYAAKLAGRDRAMKSIHAQSLCAE